MLKGMIGSMISQLAGDDPTVHEAMRADSDMMHRLCNVGLVKKLGQIHADRRKLLRYQEDEEVLETLDALAQLSGGSAYSVQQRMELAAAEAETRGMLAMEADEEDDWQEEAQEEEGEDEVDAEERDRRRNAARQMFQDKQLRRMAYARAELAAVFRPLTYDVPDWHEKPWFEWSSRIGEKLKEQGFCVLKGTLPPEKRGRAFSEAQRLQKSGGFTRPPREVLSGLFGDIGSAWTRELSDPSQPAPHEDSFMREFDTVLDELGDELGGVSESCFGMRIKGRTVGVAHLARMPGDGVNPPLVDPEEADAHMMLFMRKKIKMIYYVGPTRANMRIFTVDDQVKAYKTTLEAGTIVALRGDVCRCLIDTLNCEPGLTVEVDFLAEEKLGQQESARDRIRPPEELLLWYANRLYTIVTNNVVDGVPADWVMLARTCFFKADATPIHIKEVTHYLPTMAQPEDNWTAPFQACCLGGADSISEIPSSKWDMTVYYDPDPENVDNFKMYTRHIGLLTGMGQVDISEFDLTPKEAANIDPRYLKIAESTHTCLHQVGLTRAHTRGKDVGVFLGMSGNEMQYQMATREARISKTFNNSSNAVNVSRLTYILGATGPSSALDAEDASGSAALDNSTMYLRSDRCFLSLVSSVSFIQHPLSLIVYCAGGSISWTGRCRVFDESSDGVVRSEGCITVLLQSGNTKQKLDVVSEDAPINKDPTAMLMGSGMNSKGISSSLTAPSGPAIQDVLHRALRDASYPACMVEGLDMNANGVMLNDTVEICFMKKALGSSGKENATVALRNFKSTHGETGALGGLASVAKAVFFLTTGLHGPTLHLNELSEIIESMEVDGGDATVSRTTSFMIATEVAEAVCASSHSGVNSFSTTGTNVHHIIWGEKPREEREPIAGQPLSWFPTCTNEAALWEEGVSDEEKEGMDYEGLPMQADYYVAGTFNGWTEPQKMSHDGHGEWSYIMKLGDNRWEAFQIWLGGSPDHALHPSPLERGGATVMGPTEALEASGLLWVVDGRPDKIRLVNEEQWQDLLEDPAHDGDKCLGKIAAMGFELGKDLPPRPAEEAEEEHDDDDDAMPMPAFAGGFKPKGYENATMKEMPVLVRNKELIGMPGDLYKITLLLGGLGEYRKVTWCKLDATHPPWLGKAFQHSYHVFGTHTFNTCAKMEAAAESGFTARVQLLERQARFAVLRDEDPLQAFYPAGGSTGQDAKIMGPRQLGPPPMWWKIEGDPGDVFQVNFQRAPATTTNGKEKLSISWRHVGNEAIDNKELTKDFGVMLVGDDGFHDMKPSEDRSQFTADVSVDESGRYFFRLLYNGDLTLVVNPGSRNASFRAPDHELVGPHCKAPDHLNMWAIGMDAEDEAEAGSRFRVTFEVSETFLPKGISWRKLAPEEAPPPAEEKDGATAEAAEPAAEEEQAIAVRPEATSTDVAVGAEEESEEDGEEGGGGQEEPAALEDRQAEQLALEAGAAGGAGGPPPAAAALEDRQAEQLALEAGAAGGAGGSPPAAAALEDRQAERLALEAGAGSGGAPTAAAALEDRGRDGSDADWEVVPAPAEAAAPQE